MSAVELYRPARKRGGQIDFDFSDEWSRRICDWIANGGTLTSFCAFSTHPSAGTIGMWLRKYPEFAEDYARAREMLADYLADQAVDISDTPKPGSKIIEKGDGTVEVHHFDMLEHRKLQVTTRQWATSVIAPKKYGQRQTLKHEGAIGGAAQVEVTPEQQERMAREMLIQRGYEFE